MKKEVTVRSVSASSLLGIAFIVLKLIGVIEWSWLWVLSPFWIPIAVSIIIIIICTLIPDN